VLERRAPTPAGRSSPPLVRHADFTTWQLPEEEGDDEPILADAPGRGPRRSSGNRDDRREAERSDPEASFNRFEPESGRQDAPEDLVEIFINVGRRDGARASDFQRLLVERAGLGRSSVQRIRVRERNAFVSVRKDELNKALAALHGAAIAGKTATAEQARERGSNGGSGGRSLGRRRRIRRGRELGIVTRRGAGGAEERSGFRRALAVSATSIEAGSGPTSAARLRRAIGAVIR
jgi:ATP-dependent RNA helicase DeaD